MQHIHDCNGIGLPDFPTESKMTDVNIWIHDSGMVANHDYSCPVCRDKNAVLEINTGLMQPCWSCQEKGYVLLKKKRSIVEKIFSLGSPNGEGQS